MDHINALNCRMSYVTIGDVMSQAEYTSERGARGMVVREEKKWLKKLCKALTAGTSE